MAVPTLTDLRSLTPYSSGGGSVSLPSGSIPFVAKGPSGCVARYFYEGVGLVEPGEEFSILARYFVPTAWANGGGTILRVESYAPQGSLLCRLEVDLFRDNYYRIVRNAHYNSTGNTADYTDFGVKGPTQIVGRQFDMALHGVLDSAGKGYAELYLDGKSVIRVDGRTWYDNAYKVDRARFCLVQGPGSSAECRLHAAQLVAGLKTTTSAAPPVEPTPPQPPTADPCADVKAQLGTVTQQRNALALQLEQAQERLAQIHTVSAP
jgi:hypothetical protein